eukprot:scaffold722_cov255-Prasinococcus_capsulatus_cf.AAC.8
MTTVRDGANRRSLGLSGAWFDERGIGTSATVSRQNRVINRSQDDVTKQHTIQNDPCKRRKAPRGDHIDMFDLHHYYAWFFYHR